jgi:hypothetical protein
VVFDPVLALPTLESTRPNAIFKLLVQPLRINLARRFVQKLND